MVIRCSNNYLGMGQHPKVIEAIVETSTRMGAGAGGTRNRPAVCSSSWIASSPICMGGVEKKIWRHDDVGHLEELLAAEPTSRPKLIVFEALYSMDGDTAPVSQICDLADRYGAMTYTDEVHSVGMYGPASITPTLYHDGAMIDAPAEALIDVWGRPGLPPQYRALAAE